MTTCDGNIYRRSELEIELEIRLAIEIEREYGRLYVDNRSMAVLLGNSDCFLFVYFFFCFSSVLSIRLQYNATSNLENGQTMLVQYSICVESKEKMIFISTIRSSESNAFIG